jgi:glycerophosphoryl diester phosphodiesterase
VFKSPRPLVFAHRGGAKLGPENTLVAFEQAMSLGVDGFELDVHLAADGTPVVIHDPTLDRTTNRNGPVAALTASELARVDAGYHFAADGAHPFRGRGHGVPTLEEVVARFPAVRLIIEMKDESPPLARAVVGVVRRHGAAARVCVGSFHQAALDALRAEAPEIVTSASVGETRATLRRSWVRWPWVGPRPYVAFTVPERSGRTRVVTRAFLRQAHREGQVVHVWVVDRPDDVRRLLAWGVDGVITDRPDVTLPARDAWAAQRRALPHGGPLH